METDRALLAHVSHLRPIIFAAALLVPAVAGAADAGVSLYLQPLPADAARLSFGIAAVSAVTGGGTAYPLEVGLQTVSQATGSRQRLLASGRLPAGSYTGFSLKVRGATLASDQGAVALAVPEAPILLDAPFVVASQQASLFWLRLEYRASVANGSAFTPIFSAVVPPKPLAGRAAFVSNTGSNSITVVDKQLGQAVAVIDTCGGPSGMALDARAARLYVACERDDEVQAIDVIAAQVVERSRLGPGDRPRELALTPDGRTLVSVNAGSNSVTFFDAAPLARLDRIDVDDGPVSVTIDPAGRRAFVFNALASTISVVDLSRRAVAATMSTESAPIRGQFSASGDRLLVVHERSPYVTVVDPRQMATVKRERLRARVGAIKIDVRRSLVYIGDRDDQVVEFYDPNTLLPLDAMKVGGRVSHLAIDAEQNTLYIVSAETRRLMIGSLAERKVISAVDVGPDPYWVAVMGEQ